MITPVDREREVWRDFRRAQGDAIARRVRENPFVDVGTVFLFFVTSLLVSFTDLVVWWGSAPDFLFPVPSFRLFLASLLLLPLNGWRAHRLLTRWTPQDQERPGWIRAARFVAASLFPFGGIAIVPVWQELLRRNPDWIRPRDGRPVRLTLRGTSGELPKHRVFERFHRSDALGFLLNISSTLPFFLGGLIAVAPEGQRGAIAFNLGLHLVTFLSASRSTYQLSYLVKGNRWARLLPVSLWSLLFPTPVCTAGVLIIAFAVFGPMRGPLIGHLYSLDSDALRFPIWRQASQAFRPTLRGFSWADLSGRLPAADPLREGRSASRREALTRLTLLFLAPEAGLLTWSILSAAGWQVRESTLTGLAILACSLAFGSVLLQAFPGAAEKLGWDRTRALAPYLRSGALLLPAAGSLTGLLGGVAAARSAVQLAGVILGSFALFLFLLGAVNILRGLVTKRIDLGYFITWGFLFSVLAPLTIFLKTTPGLANRAVILVLVVPCLHLLAGIALLPDLLRPFTWRHIFERHRPGGFRAVLAVLTLTAILPLGGLAAPFWIWARQSLWPRCLQEAQD